MKHHLILVRELDQQMSGSCARLQGEFTPWGGSEPVFPERRERMNRVGEIYRAVREAYGEEVRITILDPRNLISFVPMVARDAARYGVPWGDAVRTMISGSVSTGVFDGQILFERRLPAPAEVLELIAGRMRIARVGAAPDP
jgi:hypothetical protein